MRAPGHPQGWFGAELFLDELAAKAGIDPLEFRLRNDREDIRQDQWRFGAERFGWAAARARKNEPGARLLHGVGLSSARWGQLGNPGRPPHGITCRIHQDGSVESRSGAMDIGVGTKTVLAIVTAEELGIAPKLVAATAGHTSDPSGPASGGSTVTPSIAPAARHAPATRCMPDKVLPHSASGSCTTSREPCGARIGARASTTGTPGAWVATACAVSTSDPAVSPFTGITTCTGSPRPGSVAAARRVRSTSSGCEVHAPTRAGSTPGSVRRKRRRNACLQVLYMRP
jgi:hypothetical protein